MFVQRMRGRINARLALAVLVIALTLGAVSAGQLKLASMGAGDRWTIGHALIMQTPYWVIWALLLPLIFWFTRLVPLNRNTLAWSWLAFSAFGLGLSLLHYTIAFVFMGLIGHANWNLPGHSFGAHFIPDMRFRLLPSLIGYIVGLGAVLALEYYRKYRERELAASQLAAQLAQSRLQALRMQLNPHFLFNAMNSIAMLVRRNANPEAVRMLAGLSELLRHVLDDARDDQVTLADELRFIERYLSIERVRFQDRLRVRIDVAEETLGALVPALLLQPLVENALLHGLGRKPGPGTIEIGARRVEDRLLLEVRDDGVGLSEPLPAPGVGLVNTRKRIEQIWGGGGSFELRARPEGGAVAMVAFPFQTARPAVTGSTAA